MINVSDGQANWIRRRLLREGVSLFGIQFFNAASSRNALCLRRGVPLPQQGQDTLRFTLHLRALERMAAHPECGPTARHPGACLAALNDLAAAGWLDGDPAWRHEILPPALDEWLAELRNGGHWVPEIDHRLLGSVPPPGLPPLAVCAFGWDASCWPSLDLLSAVVREAQSALVFAPLPRGSSEAVQMEWFTALEETFEESFDACDSVGFAASHASMVSRLEGTDLFSGEQDTVEPELLVGLNLSDAAALTRDFVARWLAANPEAAREDVTADAPRLVILAPRRDLSAVTLLRSLAAAGIDVEDEIGEVPEPSLAVQIQRAILVYHQAHADIESFMAIVELLNEHVAIWDGQGATVLRAIFPLDESEVRRTLHTAFGDVQHHNVRVLSGAFERSRSSIAPALRKLIGHLGEWPEHVAWLDALSRWSRCLAGLGLSTELLEPLWSQLHKLPLTDPVPATAFFQFLGDVLECAPARRSPDGLHRYAKVVLTTLDGAMGQTWGAAVFLDSNEGAWPLYPAENAFFDDKLRADLNQRRLHDLDTPGSPRRGYLLTSADRAQLEHFRFMEILGNCVGPVAFVGLARDPVEPGKELYANEWALRCLLETGKPLNEGEKLLDRWHTAIRRAKRLAATLPKAEAEHLRAVFDARRDARTGFNEYGFNFAGLTSKDELPMGDAWSVRDLETAWSQPATFALKQIFGVAPARSDGGAFKRGEGWMVGRLVHQWLPIALGNPVEPQEITPQSLHRALHDGLAEARRATEKALRLTLIKQTGAAPDADAPLPFWWHSALQKAHWAASRCLEALAQMAAADGGKRCWLSVNRRFEGDVVTGVGGFRLHASCDVMLADQTDLSGAACQMIDFRTGSSAIGALTADRLASGQGLHFAALFSLALNAGARADETHIGVIQPDSAAASMLPDEAREAAAAVLAILAGQQRSLNFGQRANPTGSGNGHKEGEHLPLATVPIDPAVLAGKLGQTEGVAT